MHQAVRARLGDHSIESVKAAWADKIPRNTGFGVSGDSRNHRAFEAVFWACTGDYAPYEAWLSAELEQGLGQQELGGAFYWGAWDLYPAIMARAVADLPAELIEATDKCLAASWAFMALSTLPEPPRMIRYEVGGNLPEDYRGGQGPARAGTGCFYAGPGNRGANKTDWYSRSPASSLLRLALDWQPRTPGDAAGFALELDLLLRCLGMGSYQDGPGLSCGLSVSDELDLRAFVKSGGQTGAQTVDRLLGPFRPHWKDEWFWRRYPDGYLIAGHTRDTHGTKPAIMAVEGDTELLTVYVPSYWKSQGHVRAVGEVRGNLYTTAADQGSRYEIALPPTYHLAADWSVADGLRVSGVVDDPGEDPPSDETPPPAPPGPTGEWDEDRAAMREKVRDLRSRADDLLTYAEPYSHRPLIRREVIEATKEYRRALNRALPKLRGDA